MTSPSDHPTLAVSQWLRNWVEVDSTKQRFLKAFKKAFRESTNRRWLQNGQTIPQSSQVV